MQPVTIWNDKTIGSETLKSFGYATYRLHLNTGLHGERLALRLPPPLTSYRVFVDGSLVSEAGKPAASADGYVARRKSALIYFTPASDETEILSLIHI